MTTADSNKYLGLQLEDLKIQICRFKIDPILHNIYVLSKHFLSKIPSSKINLDMNTLVYRSFTYVWSYVSAYFTC